MLKNTELLQDFTKSLATENNIDTFTAKKITNWLEAEGALDLEVIAEGFEVNV